MLFVATIIFCAKFFKGIKMNYRSPETYTALDEKIIVYLRHLSPGTYIRFYEKQVDSCFRLPNACNKFEAFRHWRQCCLVLKNQNAWTFFLWLLPRPSAYFLLSTCTGQLPSQINNSFLHQWNFCIALVFDPFSISHNRQWKPQQASKLKVSDKKREKQRNFIYRIIAKILVKTYTRFNWQIVSVTLN